RPLHDQVCRSEPSRSFLFSSCTRRFQRRELIRVGPGPMVARLRGGNALYGCALAEERQGQQDAGTLAGPARDAERTADFARAFAHSKKPKGSCIQPVSRDTDAIIRDIKHQPPAWRGADGRGDAARM